VPESLGRGTVSAVELMLWTGVGLVLRTGVELMLWTGVGLVLRTGGGLVAVELHLRTGTGSAAEKETAIRQMQDNFSISCFSS